MMTTNTHTAMPESWNGNNRRARYDRRLGSDRRTLIRFETLGCDRRLGTPRRKAEMIWERDWFSRGDRH
ncbi:MAG: hypothetical protein QG652_288 [Pseudomonadota bacterium]|nr:hypothetical protein [Pseudomonadota bacterium]